MNKELNKLLSELISCASVTPDDAGCQTIISKFLEDLGFHVSHIQNEDVANMIAIYGSSGLTFSFVGHTDVVPVGDSKKWDTDPFELKEINGLLYGRGTADMKGSIACMLIAIKNLLSEYKNFDGKIVVILTSDEEGPAVNGIQKLVKNNLKDLNIDMCLVGEPSSKDTFGDTIKNGRRGSLSGKLTINGIQGHIAYPQNAKNPIHLLSPALEKLIKREYDSGNDFFPPTSFQISNIQSGAGASNIIPGHLTLDFNFRYSTETNAEELKKIVVSILDSESLDYDIKWSHSGEPYLTKKSRLLDICKSSVKEVMNKEPSILTDGGTSDGRFMAKICNEVIEFGLINRSIHKVNECTSSEDLGNLEKVYRSTLKKIFKN